MKRIRIVAVFLTLLTIFTVGAIAADLSPAMSVIRKRTVVSKCIVEGDEVTFKTSDFESILGVKDLKFITITKLPELEKGVLKLGGIDVIAGQSIPRGSISFLKFEPRSATDKAAAVFEFTVSNESWEGVALKCVMNVLPTVNFSPVAEGCTVETIQGVAAISSLSAYDPDGDLVSFELLSQPKKGTLKIINASTGEFVYTPDSKFKGKDNFKYRVVDVYGNVSKEATAEIKVEKNEAQIVYADMPGHWAHAAAVKLAAKGIVSHEEIAGVYYFNPDKAVSKSDFVVMLLIAAGYEKEAKPVTATTFGDDDQIIDAHKPYVALANELGMIEQTADNKFNPDKELTRVDAAVMISKLLNLQSNASLEAFSDKDSIPADAVKHISALYKEGIMGGVDKTTMAPNAVLNRAQSVTVLERVMKYTSENKKEEGILSWFGLK